MRACAHRNARLGIAQRRRRHGDCLGAGDTPGPLKGLQSSVVTSQHNSILLRVSRLTDLPAQVDLLWWRGCDEGGGQRGSRQISDSQPAPRRRVHQLQHQRCERRPQVDLYSSLTPPPASCLLSPVSEVCYSHATATTRDQNAPTCVCCDLGFGAWVCAIAPNSMEPSL
jgi:hypothetical protein